MKTRAGEADSYSGTKMGFWPITLSLQNPQNMVGRQKMTKRTCAVKKGGKQMWRKNYICSLLSVSLLVLFATGNVQAQGNVRLSPDTLTVSFLKDNNGDPNGFVSLSLISGDSDTNLFKFQLALAGFTGGVGSTAVFISPTSATISSVNVIDVGGFSNLTFLVQVPAERVDLQLVVTMTSSAVGILEIQFSDTPTEITFFNQTTPVDSVTATVIVGVDVGIDIKPGSDPNCFKINGHGVIPVAIMGSGTFDVSNIDQNSLSFGGLAVRIRGNKGPLCGLEDANSDGILDLVCHFQDDANNWSPGSDDATLTGELLDGTPIEGTDTICVVP